MGSFSISLSGLDSEEKALSVISNDLSNLNTTAFKTETPIFSDLFYQMLGSDGAGNPVQVGVGATMNAVAAPFTQGDISTTGVPTDVAIQGNGLFVLSQNGTQIYTRAGNFTVNSQGYLVDSNGNKVMGYPAVNGAISGAQTLSALTIPDGKVYPPNATANMELDMNLDATASIPAPATGTLSVPPPVPAPGETVTIGNTVYTFASSITPTSAANTVLIGTDVASTLANLAGAIDAANTGGQAAGTTYSQLTQANNQVTATSTATTLGLTAKTAGANGDNIPISTTWTAGSFGGSDLSGGADASGNNPAVAATGTLTVPPPAVPTAGETVIIGGTTYTFVDASNIANSPANSVAIGTDVASTLANLAGAIDASTTGGQSAGGTYGTGTKANSSVSATSTATALNLVDKANGAAGNDTVTSTNWAAASVGSTLTGGVSGGTYSTPLTVYDSLGASHVLTFNFNQTSVGNWDYTITIPAADVGQTGNPVTVGSGALQFDSAGNLIAPSGNVTGITVPNLADGAKSLNLTWNLYNASGTPNVTQTSESSATSGKSQDGYGAGTLQSYTIGSSGVIEGSLSNGQSVALGQIALASFPNLDGLVRIGENDYQSSQASGQPSTGGPGTGSLGTLEGGALEQSNVDISTELTQLIVAQSGYEANAKAITTANDLMQAAINLKQ